MVVDGMEGSSGVRVVSLTDCAQVDQLKEFSLRLHSFKSHNTKVAGSVNNRTSQTKPPSASTQAAVT